jgi:hypothetical protein
MATKTSVTLNSSRPIVFYGAPNGGPLYLDLGPEALALRANSIELLCNALFKDISFMACTWYLDSLDHLMTVMNGPSSEKSGVFTLESKIPEKIKKLSDAQLKLLCQSGSIPKDSSVDIVTKLYQAAEIEIPQEHPRGPCVCQID